MGKTMILLSEILLVPLYFPIGLDNKGFIVFEKKKKEADLISHLMYFQVK